MTLRHTEVEEIDRALAAYLANPADPCARYEASMLLRRHPRHVTAAHETAIRALMIDPQGDPQLVERAGWAILRAAGLPDAEDDADGAAWLDRDELAYTLVTQTAVTDRAIECRLTAIRRWLLFSARRDAFPRAVSALVRQAALNQGAWPFDDRERGVLAAGSAGTFAAAYLPPRPQPSRTIDYASPMTCAVARQYTAWPFPVWQRVLGPPRRMLDERLARLGPGAPTLPPRPELLVAGCGTGREGLRLARAAPDGRVTAIELSETSLDYARDRCAGQANLRFEQRDLHTVAGMGVTFDYISCCGVLHHLPDPEAGWAALAATLKPGGVMRVMLYSRLARLYVTAARRGLGDLLQRPITDDTLREARGRLLAGPPTRLIDTPGFYTLGGAYDLLLPEHEDPFDVPRIGRAIAALGLELLRFDLPGQTSETWYRQANPHDRWHRDLAGWHAFERLNPFIFAGMYDFTCVKRG